MCRLGFLLVVLTALFQNPVLGFGAGRSFSVYNTEIDTFGLGSRVIGGRPANPGEFPYQLQLRHLIFGGPICGATLVKSPGSDTQVAITAAHCVTLPGTSIPDFPPFIEIRAGTTRAEETGQSLNVKKIKVHPDYEASSSAGVPKNDIAILVLDGQFTLDDMVQPLDLPTQGQDVTDKVTLSGWGRTSPDSEEGADTLQTVDLPIVDSETCNGYYAQGQAVKLIFDTTFCAGTEKGEIAGCNGDSGGPAAGLENEKRYLAGVVSWGRKGCTQFPTVFTKVSSYVDWITQESP